MRTYVKSRVIYDCIELVIDGLSKEKELVIDAEPAKKEIEFNVLYI